MNKQEIVRKLTMEYQQLRFDKTREQDERIARAVGLDTRIGELRSRLAKMFYDASQAILLSPGEAARLSDKFREESRRINAEITKLLEKLGLPKDYLELWPDCKICGDTGQVGEPVREWCACFNQKLLQRVYAASNLSEFEDENFERFDITRFPDNEILPSVGITQRASMIKIRTACAKYARDFPDTQVLNLVLLGNSGLGKSFLLNCITAAVLDKGHMALKLTAFSMLSQMRAWHMGQGNMDDLLKVPLLAIDDLGTEPMLENISIEYLFTLLNERLATKQHTIIATNLTLKALQDRYTERVTSRMFQRSTTLVLPFYGRDIRFLRAEP